jgi:hypothetical protein
LERQKVETDLATRIEATTDQVIIYCPSKGMASKAALVNVSWPKENRLRPLQELCDQEVGIDDATIREEIGQLKRKHESLWQMTVFVDPAVKHRLRDLSAHCQQRFFNIPNCHPGHTATPIKSLRDRLTLTAVLTDPDPETIDRSACLEQLNGDNSSEDGPWTVPEVRARLPRISAANRPEERPVVQKRADQLFQEAAVGGDSESSVTAALPLVWTPAMFELPPSDEFLKGANKQWAKGAIEESRNNLVNALQELSPSVDRALEAKARQVWLAFRDEMSKIAARRGKRTGLVQELTRSKGDWIKALHARDEL